MTASRQLALLALLSALGALTACAGLTSSVLPKETPVEKGVAYHMPMRYFLLTISRIQSQNGWGSTSAILTESPFIADVSTTYVLKYSAHLIGKTTTKIGVSRAGLLTTAETNTTSSIVELEKFTGKAATSDAGALRSDNDACNGTGPFTFAIAPQATHYERTYCGDVLVTITPVAGKSNLQVDAAPRAASAASSVFPSTPDSKRDGWESGIYYKQMRSYIATVTSGQTIRQALVIGAPNASPVMFLPYGRTLFSANDGKIALEDGMVSSYTQANEGEFVSLLSFPATVLSAYFKAVGNVFAAFTTRDADEQKLALKRLQLEVFAQKLEQCNAVSSTPEKYKDLGCETLSVPSGN
jgi:hypothetical protein